MPPHFIGSVILHIRGILAMLVKHLSYIQLYIMHVVPPSPSLCLVFPT